MKFLPHILFLTVVSLFCSCIKNDLPLPVKVIDVLSVKGDGFVVKDADINKSERTVTLNLDEVTDPENVHISEVRITEGGMCDEPLTGVFNLTTPRFVTLYLYQEYVWMFQITQNIERYFNVTNQIGESYITESGRIVKAYVPVGTDFSKVRIERIKLGPAEVTTISPNPYDLTFTKEDNMKTVKVVYRNHNETWNLIVEETDVNIVITNSAVWEKRMFLRAAAKAGEANGFLYRKRGAERWEALNVPKPTTGTFDGEIEGLEENTEYEVMAFADEEYSSILTLKTGERQDIENKGFEEWCTLKDIVYPYKDADHPYWATGNVGSAIVGVTLTESVQDTRPGSAGSYSARLSSKYANVMGVGKFAAGNIYLGKYVRNDGTNGVVNFGRPFTAHPKGLKIWFKYTCGAVDYIGKNLPASAELEKGDPDVGTIYIAIGNWDYNVYGGTEESPIQIATKYIDETAFNPKGEAVIAYGEYSLRTDVDDWTEVYIPLEYYNIYSGKEPTHIVITCSSSRYGDYFTGSTGSIMWIDDFELVY